MALYKEIGHEAINELITGGLSIILIALGIEYFDFKYAWVKIASTLSQITGISQTAGGEVSLMLHSLGSTFPFNLFVAHYTLPKAILVGSAVLLVGLILKIVIVKSRARFIKDMGRCVYIPAVIGFMSVIILQLITTFAFKGSSELGQNLSKINSEYFIWNIYGLMFLVGAVCLIIGSVLLLVAKSNKIAPLYRIGRVILYSAYINLFYYAFIRLISTKFISESMFGGALKAFIISGETTTSMLILCIFLFTIGIEIYRYGRHLQRIERRNVLMV